MTKLRIPPHLVFYKDGVDWIAHCLEFDLIGDGATKDLALEQLSEATVEHDNPDNLFKPADGRFFRMFTQGKDMTIGSCSVQLPGVKIDDTEAREYLESGALATA